MQGAHAVFQLGKPSFKKENLLYPNTLHNKMAYCPTSVSSFRFFLSCGILAIVEE